MIYALDEENNFYKARVFYLPKRLETNFENTPSLGERGFQVARKNDYTYALGYFGGDGARQKSNNYGGDNGQNDETDSDSCSISLLSIPSNE